MTGRAGFTSQLDADSWISGVQYGILMSDAGETQTQQSTQTEQTETQTEQQQQQQSQAETSTEQSSQTEASTEGEQEEQKEVQTQQKPEPDWRDKRIAQLTARLREEQRKSAGTPPPADSAAAPGATTAAELDALVDARAAEKAAVNEFNRQCNEVASSGRETYPDEFDSRVQALQGVLDLGSVADATRYNQFLLAAIETGEAPKLLHALGGNLNEASRIMNLSPVKMAVELTRMAAKPEAQISAAPRPIRPVNGAASGSRDPISPDDTERADKLSTAEWMKRREAQLASRTVR